jgi:hypothetical protein
MSILIQIALLAGLVSCISLLWLVVRAFSKRVLWGLAVLFLSPLTAVIFGVKYWRDEKHPFLVYLATFTIAVTLGSYVFTVTGGWHVVGNALRNQQYVSFQSTGENGKLYFVKTSLNTAQASSAHGHRVMTSGTTDRQSEPVQPDPAEPMKTTNGQVAPDESKPKVISARSIETKKRYRAAYVPIAPSMADNYLGMTVKVKRLNRPEQDCVLRSVTPTALGFEQHVRGGGTLSFKYRHSEIETLRVLLKQAY